MSDASNSAAKDIEDIINLRTDLGICLKCQVKGGDLVKHPSAESYKKFLEAVKIRSELNDRDYPMLHRRLSKFTADDLIGHASWHSECYKETIHSGKIERAHKAFQRQLSHVVDLSRSDSVCVPVNESSPFTRSACTRPAIDTCFFCNQAGGKEGLHEVSSFNVGRQIREAVENSDNREWKIKLQPLSPDDARSIDIRYHLYCYVKHVQRSTHHRQQSSIPSSNYSRVMHEVSVDTEFFAILRNTLREGKFIAMDVVCGIYENLLLSHGLHQTVTARDLKTKIVENMSCEVEFARPYYNRPQTLCSSAAARSAVCQAAKTTSNAQQEMQTVMACASIIREQILESHANKWSFSGSLSSDNIADRIPLSLQMLMRWILKGTASGSEIHNEVIERTSARLAQLLMYETKTDRQVRYQSKGECVRINHSRHAENEQVLAVALKVHAYTRSKHLVQYLHKNGFCVNYTRLLRIEDELARNVLQRMECNSGVYIPAVFKKSVHIFFAVDNIDFDEDTADGKNTLHGTVIVAFQQFHDHNIENSEQSFNYPASHTSHVNEVPMNSYLRTLHGTVTPKTSPKYKDYICGSLSDVEMPYTLQDTVWMTARSCARSCDKILHQPVPTWAAYNSLTTEDDRPQTLVHTLPLIHAPAHEYSTMIDVLKQTQHITTSVLGPGGKTVVTLDMDLYIRAVKLQALNPDGYVNCIFRVGEFHTVLCTLRAIGSYIESCGLDSAWVECDMYSAVTCRQILEGKHMKRAVNAHVVTMEVLFDLVFDEFCKRNPNIAEKMHSTFGESVDSVVDKNFMQTKRLSETVNDVVKSELIAAFENFITSKKEESAMFNFFWSYVELIESLLNFIRASRQGLWLLHLASLEKLCGLFFSQNRLKYAQHIPEYLAKMHSLKDSDPLVWKEFMSGNFCVKTSAQAFSSVGVDHAIEHVNRSMKVMGGIRGITQNPTALNRFFLIAPELSRLSREAECMAGLTQSKRMKHHDLTTAAVNRQEQAVEKLKVFITQRNPLDYDGPELINFVTNCLLPQHIAEGVLESVDVGKKAFEQYTKERLIGDSNLWDRMKRMKSITWTSAAATTAVKVSKETVELKENRSLFARLALAAISRPDINMAECIGKYEFSCVSRSLFAADGSLLPCTGKSQLLNILEAHSADPVTKFELGLVNGLEYPGQNVTAVIDGMVVVQQLAATAHVRTCAELGDKFLLSIAGLVKNYGTFHVIFDNYTFQKSMKKSTRFKRTKGVTSLDYVCADNTPIKVSVANFIVNVSTKHSLTLYLSARLMKDYTTSNVKTCVVSTAEGVLSNHGDVTHLSSNHEEADTKIILHAVYAASQQQIVHIILPDTDVFILALRRFEQLGPSACVINGVGAKNKLVQLKPIYEALGRDVEALPGFHAFTGCDTTGRFCGKGKKLCWKALTKASNRMLKAFANLGSGKQPCDDDMKCFEEFVCLLYQTAATKIRTLSELRWHLFKQTQAKAEKLPPTQAAVRQHILRAHYQCIVWCNDVIPVVDLPDPVDYGWALCNGVFSPVVSLLKPAPECIVELVRCKCKAGRCRGNCSCRMAGMGCSQMCRCEGHTDGCDNADLKLNSSEDVNSDDSDNDEMTNRTVEYFTYNTDYVAQEWMEEVQEDECDNILHLSLDMETDDE